MFFCQFSDNQRDFLVLDKKAVPYTCKGMLPKNLNKVCFAFLMKCSFHLAEKNICKTKNLPYLQFLHIRKTVDHPTVL